MRSQAAPSSTRTRPAARTGSVESLTIWRGHSLEVGELALPTGYRPYGRYPLIVLQGDRRGSRDGKSLADRFVERGYAVLNVTGFAGTAADPGAGAVSGSGDMVEASFADSTLRSVGRGMDLLVERGIADPARVGFLGMGPAARPALEGLLRSPRFNAAAFIDCCLERAAASSLWQPPTQPRGRRRLSAGHEPSSAGAVPASPQHLGTPILLQVPEAELLAALDTYMGVRASGAPTDLFFHRALPFDQRVPVETGEVADRTRDWFDFWLRGLKPDPARRPRELAYWERLRERRQSAKG